MRVLSSISRRVVPAPQAVFTSGSGSSVVSPMHAWPWNTNVEGFGTKYADAGSTGNTTTAMDITPSNADAAWARGATIETFPWSFYGFGTKYSTLNLTGASAINGIGFSSAGTTLAMATTASPYLWAYPFTSGTGYGTKYADPTTSPAVTSNSIGWRNSTQVAVTQNTSPYIKVWDFTTGTGWGSKYADIVSPAGALVNGAGWDAQFDPTGTYLSVAHAASPYLHTYTWSSGFSIWWTSPSPLPADTTTSVSWDQSTTSLAFTELSTVGITAYEWVGDYGTKYANPTSTTGNYYSGSFSKDSSAFAAANQMTGFTWGIDAWKFTNGVGFGTKYTNPTGTLSGFSANILSLKFTK